MDLLWLRQNKMSTILGVELFEFIICQMREFWRPHYVITKNVIPDSFKVALKLYKAQI